MANRNDIRRILAWLDEQDLDEQRMSSRAVAGLIEYVAAGHPPGCSGMAAHRPCVCGGGCCCRATGACDGLGQLLDLADAWVRDSR
jgi:hypothetical protein